MSGNGNGNGNGNGRKPVKVLTDLETRKQILKTDSGNNVLFKVSGTLGNGAVSSSLPITGTQAYFSNDVTIDGVLKASEIQVTTLVNSLNYETSISASINALLDVSASSAEVDQFLKWNGSQWVPGDVSNGSIGAAEDGDYTDGLFTDFTEATPIGTAVDRINEVLKGLAPKVAPDLSNLEKTSGATGTNMRLAFGASYSVAGYESVTASLGATLTNKDFTEAFTAANGAGGFPVRLGAYASPVALTMSLNNNVSADAGAFTNYPAKAFNVPTNGAGAYILEVNGTQITPSGSTSDTNSAVSQTFLLSAANTASFIGSGQGFDLFRHRTATVGIPTSLWRNGHNYAKVTHVSSLGTHVTNFIDWVYDPSAAAGTNNYGFTSPTSASFVVSGAKYLSGVKYYTSVAYNFTTNVSNFYRNIYPVAGGLSFSGLTAGLSAGSVSIPTPTTNLDDIAVSVGHTFNGSYRLLGASLASTLNSANGLGKTGATTLTTNTILYDNVNTANTTAAEYFCLENYRAESGSYAIQADASNAIGAFPSGSSLAAGELAVYNGAMRYPTKILNNGDIDGSGVVHMIAGQPDYSAESGNKTYHRVFRNGSSAIAVFTLTINGGSGINVTTHEGTLNTNNIKAWIKIPGKTGWRDIATGTPAPGYSATADNLGALQGSKVTTSTSSTHTINLLTEGLAVNEYFVLRIEASDTWTNNISSITITGL
jgi:hypothetical protein